MLEIHEQPLPSVQTHEIIKRASQLEGKKEWKKGRKGAKEGNGLSDAGRVAGNAGLPADGISEGLQGGVLRGDELLRSKQAGI